MNVLYNLRWENGTGYSPYQEVANAGALFNGGLCNNGARYLGQVFGSDVNIQAAIAACSQYDMVGITDAEAEQFIRDSQASPTIQERMDAAELMINIIAEP